MEKITNQNFEQKNWRTCYYGIGDLVIPQLNKLFLPSEMSVKPNELASLFKENRIPSKYFCSHPEKVSSVFDFYKSQGSKHFTLIWPSGNPVMTEMFHDDKMNRQDYVLLFNLFDEKGRKQLDSIGNTQALKQLFSNDLKSRIEFQKLNIAQRINEIVDSGCKECHVCDNYLSRIEFLKSIKNTYE